MKSRLKHLDVNGCGITAEGARSLQDALTSGSPLLCLKLQDNSIEDEGAECLGKALAQGAALQELSLANNQARRTWLAPAHGRCALGLSGGVQLEHLRDIMQGQMLTMTSCVPQSPG